MEKMDKLLTGAKREMQLRQEPDTWSMVVFIVINTEAKPTFHPIMAKKNFFIDHPKYFFWKKESSKTQSHRMTRPKLDPPSFFYRALTLNPEAVLDKTLKKFIPKIFFAKFEVVPKTKTQIYWHTPPTIWCF